ncbi:hypothetical protein GL912_06140 [Shigella sonnei]|nr:hypothetical protein [Shigella sonnei]ELL6061431.1 hypothetical protein [Shigella sonnei]
MQNYAQLSKYIAYVQQAHDAACRRYALSHYLSRDMLTVRDSPRNAINALHLQRQLEEVIQADTEMRAALDRANQAAVLCGKPVLSPDALIPLPVTLNPISP